MSEENIEELKAKILDREHSSDDKSPKSNKNLTHDPSKPNQQFDIESNMDDSVHGLPQLKGMHQSIDLRNEGDSFTSWVHKTRTMQNSPLHNQLP